MRDNTNLVSTLVTLATLLVWLIWLQLMYTDYRNQRQPRMLIHQTHGEGTLSQCLLVNLSQQIIHILCVRAASEGPDGETSILLGSESFDAEALGPRELENVISQGPLAQGEFLRLGSFSGILEALIGRSGGRGEGPPTLRAGEDERIVEIRVAAVYGASDRSVGARRRFRLEERDGSVRVRPAQIYTEQLASRRERRIAERWLKECLDE